MECNLTKHDLYLDGKLTLNELFIAETAWQRTRGLLGRKPLTGIQGLLIKKCNSVHMIGMSYAIDLIYLDKEGVVVKTVDNFKPWRFSGCRKAVNVIELLSGMNKKYQIKKGQKIEWS